MEAMVAGEQEREIDVLRQGINLQISVLEAQLTNLVDRGASSAEHEIQLLKKEMELNKQLSKKQLELKDLEGKLTWKDWLAQPLPRIEFVFDDRRGSYGSYAQFHFHKVKLWESFDLEVAEHVRSHKEEALRIPSDFDNFHEKLVRGDADVGFVLGTILHAIIRHKPFDKFRPILQGYSKSPAIGEDRTTEPSETPVACPESHAKDIAHGRSFPNAKVLNQSNKVFLVVEGKPPGVFRSASIEPVSDLVCPSEFGMRSALRQVVKYMVSEKAAHAVLTSIDVSFFIKFVKDGEGGHLLISRGITYDARGTTLLAAFHYIMCTMADDTDITIDGCGYEVHSPASSSPDDMPELSNERFRSSRRRRRDEGSSHDGPSKRTRSQASRGGGADVPASSLHLQRSVFANGWSGNIVLGEIRGERVVVKIAPRHTSRAHVLLHEIAMYLTLRDYWGRYIPKLVDHGTTVHGTLVFLATEYVDGIIFGRDVVTEEVASAAREALCAIHSCGILHGDLHEGNIIVVNGGVRFIDLGFAKFIRKDEECETELLILQEIIFRHR